MASISVRRGTEGPRHDPYSYTEVTFFPTKKTRKPVTAHRGLGEWVSVGRRTFRNNAKHHFERLTGLSLRKAENMPDMLFYRSLRKLPKHKQRNILECIAADEAMLRNCY